MEQSETTHELTLEEAVALAILLQKNEQLVQAHERYRRVLVSPKQSPRKLLAQFSLSRERDVANIIAE